MTRGWSVLALGIVLGVGVACSDDGEDTGSNGTGGSGGSGGGSGGSPTGGGTGGAAGSGGKADAGLDAGSGGSAGSLVDGAAGSAGGAGDALVDSTFGDSGIPWPDVLFQGVWFAGWAGGLDHYSWMKFTQSAPGQPNGQWGALDSTCGSCVGYFPCQGNDGLFAASSFNDGGTHTLTLQYPQSCSGPTSEDWTILGFAFAPAFPPGALLQMSVQVAGGLMIEAFLYPSSQCNAAFTSCTSPF